MTRTTALSETLQARRAVRRGLAACIALIVAVSLAGCTSGGQRASATRTPTSSTVASTRWWSNSAVSAGSTIDPGHPDAAANKLRPSQLDYCGMLRQTLAAGRSILPGVTATDPALLTSTEAFVGELEQVAPAGVTGDWQVLGKAIVSLAKSGGAPSAMPSLDITAVTRAASAVAADARKSCGLNLSTVAAGAASSSGSAGASPIPAR